MTSPIGRRGLPSQDEPPEAPTHAPTPDVTAARRALAPEDTDSPARPSGIEAEPPTGAERPTGAPRRGMVEVEPEEAPEARRAWYIVAATTAALALLVGVLWFIFGLRDETPVAVPSPGPTGPISTPAEPVTPAPPVEPPSPTTQAVSTAPGSASAPVPPPDPGLPTVSPTATVTETGTDDLPTGPEEEPSPVSSIPGGVRLELNGVVLDMPPGWQLYADETVQGDRRLVRIRELVTDVRIQAVALTNVTGSLDDACLDLVADHRQLYSAVAEGLPVNVPVSGDAVGVSCNFSGTRTSDGVANRVEFTLLQSGGVTLVFRDTIPAAVSTDAPALTQLIAMECAAAESFGVVIDQCAITPAQADG